MLQAGASPILIATIVAAATASAEPVADVLDACDASTMAEQAGHLLQRDWSDATAPDSFASVLDESRFIQARGRLASSSYLEPWTDADVGRRWPSTYVTTLDELAEKLPLPDLPADGYRVLLDQATDTRAALWYNGCYIVGPAEENPVLVAAATGRPGVTEGDSVSGELLQGDRLLTVTVLGEHGSHPIRGSRSGTTWPWSTSPCDACHERQREPPDNAVMTGTPYMSVCLPTPCHRSES